MTKNSFKYIFGPVSSWRLGASLGVDPLSCEEKVCSMDCVYCQLGSCSQLINERKVFLSTEELLKEVKLVGECDIDYVTFSGAGEPTLAKNLGEMIEGVRSIRKDKIAVITNATLIDQDDVKNDLNLADFVLAKVDAATQETFEKVNHPLKGVQLKAVLEGLSSFRKSFKGKFALQIMFIEDNRHEVAQIAEIARSLEPDEVQLNTPLRPCDVDPLLQEEMEELKAYFAGLPTVMVYDQEKKDVTPFDDDKTVKRHGNFKDTGAHLKNEKSNGIIQFSFNY